MCTKLNLSADDLSKLAWNAICRRDYWDKQIIVKDWDASKEESRMMRDNRIKFDKLARFLFQAINLAEQAS
jgi:hypothetical protein